VPPVQRNAPAYRQLADYYTSRILTGELRPGDRLPSVREMARASGVGQNTAQRAILQLVTDGVARTDQAGTWVAERRAAISPQQRMRLDAHPASETVQVTSAGLVTCPDYVLPILGLAAGDTVIRREQVTSEEGVPARLTVTWHRPSASLAVPELLEEAPLPDPRGGAAMLAERTGAAVADLRGRAGFECRGARLDGREIPLLRLGPPAFVLAGVWVWYGGGEAVEYGEYVLPPGRVIESDLEP
jgi:DNA-binding transcriptional regulator YhcF (GntR family)